MDKGWMKRIAAALALTLVAGCGGRSAPASEPRPAPATPEIPRYQPRPVTDQCGADQLQSLIGQPRTSIPVPVDVTSRRVTCTDCPLTEDYSASRLNILYDRDTEVIERVYCG